MPVDRQAGLRRPRGDRAASSTAATSSRCRPGYATNIVVGFGRITGRTVGIVANQPLGALRRARHQRLRQGAPRSSASATRSTSRWSPSSTCPASCPGVQQEHGGIIRHGAKLLFAYSAATVPKITVILRKSYGGAYLAMCSKDLGADRVFAWPTAEIAVMGAEGAVEIVFRKEIDGRRGPKAARRAELIEEYRSTFSTPYVAAGRGLVDDIIEPAGPASTWRGRWRYLSAKRDHPAGRRSTGWARHDHAGHEVPASRRSPSSSRPSARCRSGSPGSRRPRCRSRIRSPASAGGRRDRDLGGRGGVPRAPREGQAGALPDRRGVRPAGPGGRPGHARRHTGRGSRRCSSRSRSTASSLRGRGRGRGGAPAHAGRSS